MFEIIISALIGYLLGSIPFGLILTKMCGYGDIRDIGSGNIGATNVLRTGNKKLAIATLLLDALKGAVAISIVKIMMPDSSVLDCAVPNTCGYTQATIYSATLITALFALLGHIFPIWLKFKGGKGVATGLGILLTLSWPTGLAAAATWVITAFLSRISSLSALVAVSLSPVFAYLFSQDAKLTILCAIMAIIIVSKHHTNIKRLLKGEEPKIGKKKE
ncbi:MAG: glycerol-3-phosphate acyltransferase [Alphaproteobacteria bacterium RIFCSPHIGHO2_12_FULL_45_9]|nr:MAG: glycerol-3-phosphate acyltransferase [Alphaproteobacteria bacterium RIFCSPHIGHO2_02_FULL_46_13]OFW96819.1 MAG: glycerol-3-phosphate acyltransferase [Alphaproteobacteria bacterium RIFCSPHIGHO2_12_FULL_45_9]